MYDAKDIEKVILRLCLINTYHIQQLQLRGVTADWFSEESHFNLASFIFRHYNNYKALITKEIAITKLEQIHSQQYIIDTYAQLFDDILNNITDIENISTNFEFYYDLFKKDKIKRDIQISLKTSIDYIKEDNYDKVVSTLEKSLLNIRQMDKNVIPGHTLKEISDKRVEDYYDRKYHPEKNIGMLSGIRLFDIATNGFRSPDICMLAARSGIGKSIALSVIAKNMYLFGYNIAYGSIEISEEMSNIRLESGFCDLPFDYIRDGKLSEDEEQILIKSYECIKNRKNEFYIMQPGNCKTPDGIRCELDYCISQGFKPDAVFVDYINIMSLDARYGFKGRDHEEKRKIIEELKEVAKEYDVNIWTASQVTRDAKKTQLTNKNYDPGTEALSDSDYLGNTIDFLAVFDETKEDAENGTLTTYLGKVRFGGKNKFKLKKNWRRMYLGDYDEEDEELNNA